MVGGDRLRGFVGHLVSLEHVRIYTTPTPPIHSIRWAFGMVEFKIRPIPEITCTSLSFPSLSQRDQTEFSMLPPVSRQTRAMRLRESRRTIRTMAWGPPLHWGWSTLPPQPT